MGEYQTLEIVESGDVTVARLREERITDGEKLRILAEELAALVDWEGRNRILINLDAVEYLSSSAIGALVVLRKRALSKESVVKLCGLRPDIHEVFSITQMDQLFDIRVSEEEGLSAFG